MTLILSGTNGLSDVDGSASTPAIRGTDSNTGIFFPAADTIAFAEGGAEVARFDSSGNLGIGTSSPSTYVASGGLALFNNYGTSSTALAISNNSGFSASNIARIDFRVNNSFAGNERIAAIWGINPNASANNGGALVFGVSANGTATTPSEVARIDSSGNLLVGTTTYGGGTNTPGVGFNPIGQIAVERSGGICGVFNRYTSDGSILIFRRSATQVGSIDVTTTATSYVTSSDYRLKENIQPMTGALAKVAALKPCTYTWKADGTAGQGFIAHELQEVCTDAVSGEKDAVNEDGSIKPQGIDTSFLVATLTAAIQEQQALIESLTARIAALEAA